MWWTRHGKTWWWPPNSHWRWVRKRRSHWNHRLFWGKRFSWHLHRFKWRWWIWSLQIRMFRNRILFFLIKIKKEENYWKIQIYKISWIITWVFSVTCLELGCFFLSLFFHEVPSILAVERFLRLATLTNCTKN